MVRQLRVQPRIDPLSGRPLVDGPFKVVFWFVFLVGLHAGGSNLVGRRCGVGWRFSAGRTVVNTLPFEGINDQRDATGH